MEDERQLNNNLQQYIFNKLYWDEMFENAPPVKKGSILKECKDGMWQLFEPDGKTKVIARYGKIFIKRKLEQNLLTSFKRKLTNAEIQEKTDSANKLRGIWTNCCGYAPCDCKSTMDSGLRGMGRR